MKKKGCNSRIFELHLERVSPRMLLLGTEQLHLRLDHLLPPS